MEGFFSRYFCNYYTFLFLDNKLHKSYLKNFCVVIININGL